ncbi:hypothetical protein [Chitinophaga filiformis]|uniref:Uncharacterized protein n=1 Tax=Chitinophaga filiformis TaxID=104663 RepID=A0A1G7HF49_CHIFI|nr:hypothetical protein [Chitinophaga filiformis]SDE98966.1 hypothetical protein SAMN04488121_101440 [Chitinophaga filiformis]
MGWRSAPLLSGMLLGVIKRIGVEYGLGSISRIAGEPKARHSHLKPVLLTLSLLLCRRPVFYELKGFLHSDDNAYSDYSGYSGYSDFNYPL